MVRDPDRIRRFEDEQIRRAPADHLANLRAFEAMWHHAVKLGALPSADPLEGIETDVRLAERLRVR